MHLRNERWVKMFAEARTRNKGRLEFFFASAAPPTPALTDAPPAAAGGVSVTVATPAAKPAPPKSTVFFGVLSENAQEHADFIAMLAFTAAFPVAAAVILAGPSSTTSLT